MPAMILTPRWTIAVLFVAWLILSAGVCVVNDWWWKRHHRGSSWDDVLNIRAWDPDGRQRRDRERRK